MVILGLAALGIVLLWSGDFRLFFQYLYSPYSFLILFVIVIEYIVIKSSDRSRIYQIQIAHLKKRIEDLRDKTRLIEEEIAQMERELKNSVNSGGSAASNDLHQHIKRIKEMLSQ